MLTIRLSRVGKKNKPLYRLIICEKSRDPWGKSLEILGSYNPHSKDLQVKGDRIKYWLSKGAKMSQTVNNLLIDKKIIEGKKVTVSKPSKKTAEQLKAEAAAKTAPAETKAKEPKTEEMPAEEQK